MKSLLLGFLVVATFFACSSPDAHTNRDNLPLVSVANGSIVGDGEMRPEQLQVSADTFPVASIVAISVAENKNVAEPGFSLLKCKIGQNYRLVPAIGGDEALYIPRSIMEDHTGRVWLASIGGISYLFHDSLYYFPVDSGYNVVNTLVENKEGKMMWGTGNGHVRMPVADGRLVDYKLSSDAITCSLKDAMDNIWFGSTDGVYCMTAQGWIHYTAKYFGGTNTVDMVNIGNTVWVAVSNQGITSCSEGKCKRFNKQSGLASNDISALVADQFGNLWIGTGNAGISCYNGKTFTTYTTKQGLANDSISSIVSDKYGDLWIGTENGLSRIPAKVMGRLNRDSIASIMAEGPLFINYFPGKSKRENQFRVRSACATAHGVVFGTASGTIRFTPGR